MAPKKKQKGLGRGDIFRLGDRWFHVNSAVWNDGETYLVTELTAPHFPERKSAGAPFILKAKSADEIINQMAAGGMEVDPLKGSGR